jgi:uncharacterized membrane protein YccC
MEISIPNLQRFLFGHHFYSGIRRAAGTLLPILLLGGVFGWFAQGLVASFGALCIAFIDQPGPYDKRLQEMLGGALLSTLTVALTGLASSQPLFLWVAVVCQCFGFSMLSVYGKKGALIGLACLLLMIVTLHRPLSSAEVLSHTLISFGGSVFYALFSYVVSKLMLVREKEQALAVALFSTAQYVASRAKMYNCDEDLDTSFRGLITSQADMTEKHQSARDMVLRGMTQPQAQHEPRRIMLWNLFIEMMTILDTLVASHTDYSLLRRSLKGSDTLLFIRDALYKMALDLDRIALAVARDRSATHRSSVKAELRALEFELETLKLNGFSQAEPDAYSLCVQILKRLRNNAALIDRMYAYTKRSKEMLPLQAVNINNSLSEFLSRQSFNPGQLGSNLRLDSPFCRYALRVTLGCAIAMAIPQLIPGLAPQGYWILLTVVIIMRPGFALTRQRNGWRLVGTLLGCAIAFVILYMITSERWLFVTMVLATIIGSSLVLLNYMVSSTFNTVAVLLAFYFLNPTETGIIEARAIDTIIGSAIAFTASYFMPWWEAQFMPGLARAAVAADTYYLQKGLALLRERQIQDSAKLSPQAQQADLDWRLSRKNVHVAFSNFAEAFYRMMLEPKSRQVQVAEFNNLLIQTHMLASQAAALMQLALAMPQAPTSLIDYLKELTETLQIEDRRTTVSSPPSELVTGAYPELTYPLKQLQRSVSRVHTEMQTINSVLTGKGAH